MNADSVFALENANWPVLVLDETGLVVRANAGAAKSLGREVEAGQPLPACLWAAENKISLKAFLIGLPQSSTTPLPPIKLRTSEEQITSFAPLVSTFAQGKATYYLLQLLRIMPASGMEPAVARTVGSSSDLQSNSGGAGLEGSLAHKQKLDCALQLTRTVALDFNNALTSILGHTSLILSKMEPSHPWRSSLVEVEKSAEKAAEVASDLAAFSRQEKDMRSHLAGNLNDLVRRTVELFQNPPSRPVGWALQLEPRLYTAAFDEAKMQQAFAKILDNAMQALGEQGQIVVRTRNHDVVENTQDGNVRLAPGHYVCVEFEDTGCGIAPDVLPRIFEPFFTTKNSPNHRGLGLAWVYGIVTNHGGSVAVSSQLRRGTSVRVYLPAQKKIVRHRTPYTDNLSGTETILMIDDEELLLTMGEMILSSFGYRVLTANSGQKALEIFSETPEQIDLIITDLVMPNMSGRELMTELRRLSPKLRIICTSGYIRALSSEDEELYLQKPFTSLDLLRKVKQALATSDAS